MARVWWWRDVFEQFGDNGEPVSLFTGGFNASRQAVLSVPAQLFYVVTACFTLGPLAIVCSVLVMARVSLLHKLFS